MSSPGQQRPISARIAGRLFLGLACIPLLSAGTSAYAGTVLQYGQLNPADVVTAINNGAGTTTLVTTGNKDGGNVSIPVVITNFMGTPFPNGFAAYVTYVGVTSNGPATVDPFTGNVEQLFSGKIEFTSGIGGTGANYLTAVFSAFTLAPVLGGSPNGTSATLQAAQPPDALVLTSQFGPLGTTTGMAIGFTNISPSLHIAPDHSIAGFTAQDAGTFNASPIPEPGTLALSSIAIAIGGLTYWRRRGLRSNS
jgi:PEP-CTERM motif